MPINPAPRSVQPTFGSNFSSGLLEPTKWKASNFTVANYAGAGNTVTFTPKNLLFDEGMLCIRLDQPDATHSTGGEIQSLNRYGFGKYFFTMRLSSTAPTNAAAGTVVSGSDSGGFLFFDNSESEIDIEYCGDTPNNIWLTNWINPTPANPPTLKQYSEPAVPHLADGFHTYQIDWTPTSVRWFIDNILVATHTEHVPQVPAYIMLNFWGTNDTQWGGLATPGVTRYMYVKTVAYYAA